MNINNDEALGFINRLLERLHQADLTNFGSHLQIVYVASGAQHVENQINIGASLPTPASPPTPLRKARGTLGERGVNTSMDEKSQPEVLATDKAMALWKKAQAAGWIDDNYQPLLSRTQAALLADAMAERLGIKEKWKVFEGLWNRKYMRSDYNLALTRKGSLDFQDELKRLFG